MTINATQIGAFVNAKSDISFGVGDVWDADATGDIPFSPAVTPHIKTGYALTGSTGYYSSFFVGGQFPDHFADIEEEAESKLSYIDGPSLKCLSKKGEIVYPISNVDMLGAKKPKAALLCEQQLRFLELSQYIYAINGHLFYRRLTEEGDLRLTEYGKPLFDLATEDWNELITEDGATLIGENDQDIRITEDAAAGPFAPTLVINNPDRHSLGMPDANSWVYRIDNRFACAMMYQCRPIESMCRLTTIRKGDGGWMDAIALSVEIATNFLEWYSATWEDRTTNPPTDLIDPLIGEPLSRYPDPHVAALLLRSGIYLKNSGHLTVDESFFSDLFSFLERVYAKNVGTKMFGSWSVRYPENSIYYFSYWHGEILKTLSFLANNPYFGIDQDLCKKRLSEARDWLEKYGVYSDSEQEMQGYDYYNGYLVLSKAIDEAIDTSSTFSRKIDSLDNRIVQPVFVDTAKMAFKKQTIGYTLVSKKEINWIKQFFASRKGRQYPFLLPSFGADYRLLEPANTGDYTLKVKKGSSQNPTDIMIKMSNNSLVFNTITSVIQQQGFDILNLENPLSKNLSPDNIAYISKMEVARFDQDRIEFSYKTNTVAQTTLTVKTAPEIRQERNVYF